MPKDLSIVITSYNTRELTDACIRSVLATTKGISYEIIVVDNASRDDSVNIIRKLQIPNDKLKIIVNKKNVGFAKGNNQGVKIAKGKYILLLNSDTKLTSNVIEPALNFMQTHPRVGIYSCGLRNKDGSLQPTGGYFPTLSRIFTWMFFIDDLPLISSFFTAYHPKPSFYNQSRDLDWVTGAFFLVRQEVWEENHGLDESYFMYVEELDFCFRAKKRGWLVFYNPKDSLIHYGGASSAGAYPIISEYKGLKLFYKKFCSRWQLALLRIMLKLGALARMLIFGILKGQSFFEIYKHALELA